MSRCTRTIVGCLIASNVNVSCESAVAVIAASVIARQRVNSKGDAARLLEPTHATNTALVGHAITQHAKRVGVRANIRK